MQAGNQNDKPVVGLDSSVAIILIEKRCQGTTKASRNRFKEEYLLDMRTMQA